jgi:hypothetical protein
MTHRAVKCNFCSRPIHGHGTTRVFRKIVFHFHALCWRRRSDCDRFMAAIAGGPVLNPLPESLQRCLDLEMIL